MSMESEQQYFRPAELLRGVVTELSSPRLLSMANNNSVDNCNEYNTGLYTKL